MQWQMVRKENILHPRMKIDSRIRRDKRVMDVVKTY